MSDDENSLGPCCICETRYGVANIVMLERRAPLGGRGWGCVVCGLTNDGAVAVLCDGCLDLVRAGTPPILVCVGYPGDGQRVEYAALPNERFAHDEAKHRAEEDQAP